MSAAVLICWQVVDVVADPGGQAMSPAATMIDVVAPCAGIADDPNTVAAMHAVVSRMRDLNLMKTPR
jgi:hypothetical protein